MAKKISPESKRRGVFRQPAEEKREEAKLSQAEALDRHIVDLKKDQIETFSKWLEPRAKACINSPERTEAIERIKLYRDYYEHGVPRTDYQSGKGMHDYRSQDAASQADGMKARLLPVFTENPIFKMEGRNKLGVDNAPTMEKFMDYHHDRNIRLGPKGDTIAGILSNEGHVVFHSPWALEIADVVDLVPRQKYVREGKFQWVDSQDQEAVAAIKNLGFSPVTPEEFMVEERTRKDKVKNWPDLEIGTLEDYCWKPGVKPGQPIPLEAFRKKYTYGEIKSLEERGQAYPGTSTKLKDYLLDIEADKEQDESSGGGNSRAKKKVVNESDAKNEDDLLDHTLYCWVFYGDKLIPGMRGLQKAITIYHADSNTTIQVKLNKNIDRRSNIQNVRLFQTHFRFAGIGMIEISHTAERYMTDLFNYSLDMTRVLSALPFLYLKKRYPAGLSSLEFMKGLGVDRFTDIKELNLPDRRGADLGLVNFIRANLERRSSITDRHLGRVDEAQPGKATATEFVKVMGESQFKLNLLSFSLFFGLLEWCEHEIMLFQQYGANELVKDVTDKDGNEIFPKGLSKHQILGFFRVQPNISAQNMIRELDAQMNIFLYNMLKDNKLIAASLESFYKLTDDTIKAVGKKNSPLKPLEEYQKATGRAPEYSPEESKLVDQMIAEGKSKEEIEAFIAEKRAGREPQPQPQGTSQGLIENAAAMLGGQQ